ncbi:hypothetical protein P7L90_08300, partial [Bisgaard Taxon 10/6]|nr:hypothetical protein [Exercitatus varius]MDG2958413.1 hypothetical protein [Exercitatus varius]
FLCVIANAITYGFATVGKANVQKALLFVTALSDRLRVNRKSAVDFCNIFDEQKPSFAFVYART